MKYVRLYGLEHKRTEGQFTVTWNELQEGLPKGPEGSFLLGVSENKLLLDGTPLETGQAERSFAQLLTTAGLASIHFSNQVTKEEFVQLVRAFAMGGSRAQDVVKEIKNTFGDSKTASIRINEVRFVAADPSTGEISIAAQIAAQTLGPEFKQWLNDPQKLLQLIAAAEGAKSGAPGEAVAGNVPVGSVPNVRGTATATEAAAAGGAWAGGIVPLQEEEVIQTIRLLTRFGEVGGDANADTSQLQKELTTVDPNTRVNLQQLLGTLYASSHGAQRRPNCDFTAWHLGVAKPVIAAVNGVCAGGGLHFVADADIVIAAANATFLDPHVSVGQVTAFEAIGLLRKMPAEAVMRMALVGRMSGSPRRGHSSSE